MNALDDHAPLGTRVRYRSPDGKLRTLEKVAELPGWVMGLAPTPLKSLWYDLDDLEVDRRRHPVLLDPVAVARFIAETPVLVQENKRPFALRLYGDFAELRRRGLVGPSRRLRYVILVAYFNQPGSGHPYNFIKSLHPKRGIIKDTGRVLWPEPR